MSVQGELIGKLLVKFGSKKEAAAAAGLSLSRFSNYFHENRSMDDDAVIGCAEALGLDPVPLIHAHKAEVASTSREASFWKRMGSAAAVVLLVTATLLPGVGTRNASASAETCSSSCNRQGMPIMSILRVLTWPLRKLARRRSSHAYLLALQG